MTSTNATRSTGHWIGGLLALLFLLAQPAATASAVPAGAEPARASDNIPKGRLQVARAIASGTRARDAGTWDAEGRKWSVGVRQPGARWVSLRVRARGLPKGTRLHLQGDTAQRSVTIEADGETWTPSVAGENVKVVLEAPRAHAGEFEIVEVHHGYRLLDGSEPYRSGSCNVDLACPAAGAWSDESRSVARMVIDGIYLCTGTLLNNTARDGAPLLLTAAHCVPDAASARSVVVYWNYQASACNGAPDGSLAQTQSGATLLVTSAAQDLSVLRLDAPPPVASDAFFAGWDRSTAIPAMATTIHHPSGQEKRISWSDVPLQPTAQFVETVVGSGDFLMVPRWTVGTTEPGSSGAGLWNPQHRLVGVFSGGYSSCSRQVPDWFGRLGSAWNAATLAPVLDPLATGVTALDGMNADGSSGLFPQPATARDAPAPQASGGAWLAPGLLLAMLSRRRRQKG